MASNGAGSDARKVARTDVVLSSIVESTAPSIGRTFLQALVRELGTGLNARRVYVGELADPSEGIIKTICVWADGRYAPNFEIRRDAATSEKGRGNGHGTASSAPVAGIELPLIDTSGDEVGVLAIHCDDHLEASSDCLRLLNILSARAGAEIERTRTEELMREQAERDPLTRTLHHAAVTRTLETTIADPNSEHFAFAVVDVDGMKATNDTYGHQVGDQVLNVVATALAKRDAIVGRYGGDEFVAILRGADRDEAEAYREEVTSAAADATIETDAGVRVPVSISVGLAIFPDEARTSSELLELADSNMYASRRERWGAHGTNASRRLGGERAARLLGEIVPLLTAAGTRDEKLTQVANQLSVGAGYAVVNFEMAGGHPGAQAEWERAYMRGSADLLDAWMREQSQTSDHPLSRELDRTRRPLFVERTQETTLLTEPERELLKAAGVASGLVVPMIWQDRRVGMLSVGATRESAFTAWDAQFLTTVASQVTAIVFMTDLVEELESASADLAKAHTDTVLMLATAAEAHDTTTGRHLQRVCAVTEALARELGYTEGQSRQMGLAAILHDIGKIRVPDEVLTKPGKLTDDEWVVMRQHTTWGAEFLGGRYGFEMAADVARCHHERWEGGGYPRGLKGDEIPEAAQITCVADTFDAITNDRPYRPGRPAPEAVIEIVAHAGTQFSPKVVDALVRLFEQRTLPYADSGVTELKAA